ncbi:MAG: hypothetical protein OEM22_00775 [Acidimicrobiia bacterium]|nr:hypothetical protein [Acidimicrobiia bacterium]MDH3470160.1 hypothetical protein [Acidimicrobiia bacterium]
MNALERLERANPVPNHDRLLDEPGAMDAFVFTVEEKSEITHKNVTDSEPSGAAGEQISSAAPESRLIRGLRNLRRGEHNWLVAAAAAVTVLAAGAALVMLTSPSGDSDAAAPAGSDQVAVVLSAYDALNAGDIDAWIGHFTDEAIVFGATTPIARNLYEVQSAANYQAVLVERCRRVGPTSQGEAQVECTITEADDFHGAGGISLTRNELFVVNEDGQISEVSAQVIAFTQPGYYVFNQAFFDWLRIAHPNVHDEIRPELTTHLPERPEHMRTALDFVDEFLAQSDVYPITDGS